EQILPALQQCNAAEMVEGQRSLFGEFSQPPSSHPVAFYRAKKDFQGKK
ncbi:hypothetical protein Anapl_12124, partial [Anas platyrhynchos]